MKPNQEIQPKPSVSVIIPFYQEKSGILRKAVLSALGQMYPVREVLIVDDGSPMDPYPEIKDLIESNPDKIRLIRQKNAGAGPARNTAFDRVSPDAEYVAFLDSDDEWYPDHIQTAVSALERGYDLYFCNFIDFSSNKDFQSSFCPDVIRTNQRPVNGDPSLHEFRIPSFDVLIHCYVIGTTSVCVARYATIGDLRFRDGFPIGEDRFFWLDLLRKTSRTIFTSDIHCYRGSGINISAKGQWDWDSSHYLWPHSALIHERKKQIEIYSLSGEKKAHTRAQIKKLRIDAWIYMFYRLGSHRVNIVILRLFMKLIISDPIMVLQVIPALRMWSQRKRAPVRGKIF